MEFHKRIIFSNTVWEKKKKVSFSEAIFDLENIFFFQISSIFLLSTLRENHILSLGSS